MLGALFDGGDERDQFFPPLLDLGIPLLRLAGRLLVGPFTDGAEVVDLAVQPLQSLAKMVGEKNAERSLVPPVDRHPGDERFLLGRERPVDRTALVHLAVNAFEELRPQVVAKACLVIDRAAVFSPDSMERFGRVMAETIAEVVRFKRAVEEENPRWGE